MASKPGERQHLVCDRRNLTDRSASAPRTYPAAEFHNEFNFKTRCLTNRCDLAADDEAVLSYQA